MRRINVYYVVSIVSLAFMMLILLRTLQVRGWFEEHRVKTPAEYLLKDLVGTYDLSQQDNHNRMIQVIQQPSDVGVGWLVALEDSIPFLILKISNFEDDQVLVELFSLDSANQKQRIDGCELLVSDIEGVKTGSTLGEFCGLKGDSQVYIDLDVTLDMTEISLQVESRHFEDQSLIKREDYLLERQKTRDE